MKRENFYRRDPSKALSGMIGLTLEERGVYNTVLDLLYSTWRPLEDDRAFIANWCGCAVQKLNPIIRRLVEKGRLITFEESGRTYLSDDAFEAERSAVKGGATSRSGRTQTGEKSGEVEEKSPGVEEKSAGVGQNPPTCDENISETPPVTPLEKTRLEQTRQEPTTINAGDPDWGVRLAEAQAAAGDGMDRTSTGLMHARDLRALCEPSTGDPCEWGEVLDAVRMCAARAKSRGKPLRSWSWVKDDALALRDKRLTSHLPQPEPRHERSYHDPKFERRQANLAAFERGADLAARLHGKP
jgi:hypothetical protein